ncbi:eotaxin-like [Ictalurus furcatus]|uniref:eotaxin-like n=1 Tax=Ictalurus furcatus TaxID=66913 RepID=UPI00234FC731|nr:eotaxin-like [Ictalurus furcatus]
MESSSLTQHSTPVSWISNSHSGPSLCEIRLSARMRNLTALLFLLSLCSLHLVSSVPTSFNHITQCCTGTFTVKIPLKNIVNYRWTSNDCPIKAIVFETLNNGTHYRCVDPTAVWVNHHMKAVDRKNKKL